MLGRLCRRRRKATWMEGFERALTELKSELGISDDEI